MKATGIVRQVDELGRIVIPIELRRVLDINVKDSLEIYVDNDSVVLKKYEVSCVFCGENEDLTALNGKYICPDCIEKLKK